jgi:hypothetical protein
MKRVLKPIIVVLAVLYFLIDLLFLSIVRPVGRWLMRLPIIQRLQTWIDTLNRYTALALFLLPVVLLEPVKPLGFYLMAHRHFWFGLGLIIIVEFVKLTLIERLFHMTQSKLMTFGWFAWCYHRWEATIAHFRSLPIWRAMTSRFRSIGLRFRAFVVRSSP